MVCKRFEIPDPPVTKIGRVSADRESTVTDLLWLVTKLSWCSLGIVAGVWAVAYVAAHAVRFAWGF